MWWLFEKQEETTEKVTYRYARESTELDGTIEYKKVTKGITVTTPCKADKESEWCISKAIGKFAVCVVDEGFPDKRKVVIG